MEKITVPTSHRYFMGVALIACFVTAMEVALTRYFSTASWSTYGYFIISIALFGFSISGTILTLFKDFFTRHAALFLVAMPLILMPVTSLSYLQIGLNDFNILEFQNALLWWEQIQNIALYYLVLFWPYFFSGLYIGIAFIVFQDKIGAVYAYDLIAAAVGALLILVLMFWVHPFYLVVGLQPMLFLAALCSLAPRKQALQIGLGLILLAGSTYLLFPLNTAHYSKYKPIFAPLNVQNNTQILGHYSPRGYFEVLDNFTERVDVALTNNYTNLKLKEPPRAYGLYRDGYRISALKNTPEEQKLGYLSGLLSALPYRFYERPYVLQLGLGGGYHVREGLQLGADAIEIVEATPDFLQLLQSQAQNNADILEHPGVEILITHPRSHLRQSPDRYDLIEITEEMVPTSGHGDYLYTQASLESMFAAIQEKGMVSLVVPIRENYVYALKLLETARQMLLAQGKVPAEHIVLYRTAWVARILLAKTPFTAGQIQEIKQFCDDRSFDLSFYPGITPETMTIWNELPPFKLVTDANQNQGMISLQAEDALMDGAVEILGKTPDNFLANYFFDLQPSTDNRPYFYSILRPSQIQAIPPNLPIIPLEEMDYLVNWVILGQAILLGLVILALPLLKPQSQAAKKGRFQLIIYFICLGLGYFFVEITLIEKFNRVFSDPTFSFALILSVMLVCSGLGSALTGGVHNPEVWLRRMAIVMVIATLVYVFALDFMIVFLMTSSLPVQLLAILILAGLPAFFLGMPFPLGMAALVGEKSYFVPWAWSINGAFSVVSAVLSKLIFVTYGYTLIFILACIVYILAWLTFPKQDLIRGRINAEKS